MQFFALKCANISEIEIVAAFESPLPALQYVRQTPIDMAVLDI